MLCGIFSSSSSQQVGDSSTVGETNENLLPEKRTISTSSTGSDSTISEDEIILKTPTSQGNDDDGIHQIQFVPATIPHHQFPIKSSARNLKLMIDKYSPSFFDTAVLPGLQRLASGWEGENESRLRRLELVRTDMKGTRRRGRTMREIRSLFDVVPKLSQLQELGLHGFNEGDGPAIIELFHKLSSDSSTSQVSKLSISFAGGQADGHDNDRAVPEDVLQAMAEIPNLKAVNVKVNSSSSLSKLVANSSSLEELRVAPTDGASGTKTKTYTMTHGMALIKSLQNPSSSLRVLDLGPHLALSPFCLKLLADNLCENTKLTHLYFSFDPTTIEEEDAVREALIDRSIRSLLAMIKNNRSLRVIRNHVRSKVADVDTEAVYAAADANDSLEEFFFFPEPEETEESPLSKFFGALMSDDDDDDDDDDQHLEEELEEEDDDGIE